MQPPTKPADRESAEEFRKHFRADCERCVGLCCVASTFSKSADFAIDKSAGIPCPNLDQDFRCSIHATLRQDGFPGCAAYDCFGAGQKISQETFAGSNWRDQPETATRMFETFAVMQQLHKLLYYLSEGVELCTTRLVADENTELLRNLEALRSRLMACTDLNSEQLLQLDLSSEKDQANQLLLMVSKLVRSGDERTDGTGGTDRTEV